MFWHKIIYVAIQCIFTTLLRGPCFKLSQLESFLQLTEAWLTSWRVLTLEIDQWCILTRWCASRWQQCVLPFKLKNRPFISSGYTRALLFGGGISPLYSYRICKDFRLHTLGHSYIHVLRFRIWTATKTHTHTRSHTLLCIPRLALLLGANKERD